MIIFLDKDGAFVGSNTGVGYPAPPEVLERLRAGAQDPIDRVEDCPPFEPEHWHWPAGSPGPVVKPQLAVTVSKAAAKADETDAVIIENVPAGATIVIGGTEQGAFVADGKPIALAFSAEGQHDVRIRAPGHLERRIELRSTESATARRRRRVRQLADTHQEVVIGIAGQDLARRALSRADQALEAETRPYAEAMLQEGAARQVLAGIVSAPLATLAEIRSQTAEELAADIVRKVDAYWALQHRRERVRHSLTAFAGGTPRRREVAAFLRSEGLEALMHADRPFALT